MSGQTTNSAQNALPRGSFVNFSTQSGATNIRVVRIPSIIQDNQDNETRWALMTATSMTHRSALVLSCLLLLSVNFAQHDIYRPDQSHHIGYEMSDGKPPQRLQVNKRRRPYSHPVWFRRAVAYQIDTDLAFRSFNPEIDQIGRAH